MTRDRVQNSDEDLVHFINEDDKIDERPQPLEFAMQSATLLVRFSAMLFGTCRSL